MSDATARPMKIPDTFIPYLEKYRIYELLQELLSRLIIHKPEDHLEFLRNEIFEVVKLQKSSNPTSIPVGEMMKGIKVDSSTKCEMTSKHSRMKVENNNVPEKTSLDSSEEKIPKVGVELHINDNMLNESGLIKKDDGMCTTNDVTMTYKDDKEYSNFCEQVISDWRKIRRSKKWFSIRHLSSRNDNEDDYKNLNVFKKVDKNTISDYNDLLNFSFQTEEKLVDEFEADNFQSSNMLEEDRSKVKKSIKTFNVKLYKGDEITDENSRENMCEHVIGLSYISAENSNFEKEENIECNKNTMDYPIQLLDSVPGGSIEDVKAYIVKLVQKTVDEIVRENPNEYPQKINYNFCEKTEIRKRVNFPRGPYMIPRVVILGPPGSGKSLQASLLAEKLNLIHVEMDTALLKENLRTNKIPSIFEDFCLRDCSLMTELCISILKKRFLEEDCLKHGWVLTGFPINATQALALDEVETPPNRIIYLHKPVDMCREILLTRILDVDTGKLCFLRPDHLDINISSSNLSEDAENEIDLFSPSKQHNVTVNGNVMKSVKPDDKIENHDLLSSISRSAFHKLKVLRPPGGGIKAVNRCLVKYEAAKDGLLLYYGEWCKRLEVGDLPPQRIHEAVLSVVMGPSPSFEEAGINDRTTDEESITGLSSQIEAVLKSRLTSFLSDPRSDASFN